MNAAHAPEDVIVVGVSPTSGSRHAIRWAADEALSRSVPLVAVRAWRPSRPPTAPAGRPPGVARDLETELASARQKLREDVDAVVGGELPVSCRVVRGAPLTVLLRESATATLLVVDAPPRFDLGQTPLLAQRLVYRATCPVLVMPPAVAGRPLS